jgi:FlaA1/EpsC-like NDP-sugar epimerase
MSGFEPGVDIKIDYIGLRPGEKLHEELITEGEGILSTPHEKILVLEGTACDLAELEENIDDLDQLAKNQDGDAIRQTLSQILPDYHPQEVEVEEEF